MRLFYLNEEDMPVGVPTDVTEEVTRPETDACAPCEECAAPEEAPALTAQADAPQTEAENGDGDKRELNGVKGMCKGKFIFTRDGKCGGC